MQKSRSALTMIAFSLIGPVTVAMLVLRPAPAAAEAPMKQQKLVDKALVTITDFLSDPDMAWFRENAKESRGLLIIPELIKAGFVFGTSGGRGVLFVRNGKDGRWQGPAFYMIGSVSLGFQAGVKKSELIMMVMSPKGLDPLYGSSFKLGGEASVAAGPVGAGAEGATATNLSADYLSFARSKGAFAGLSLEGAFVYADGEWNGAYYGKRVTPADILVDGSVDNPHADKLRRAVEKTTKK